jgi:prolyl-tRNA synthetase
LLKKKYLKDIGAPKGYMSPLGLNGKISVLFDEAINVEKSYIVGANKENYHVKGFVPSRDVEKYKVADLRLAKRR